MKFFWKIFFSTLFISVLCLSLGSYFLINANFEDGLNQEVKVAYELCDMINYSLNSETIMDDYRKDDLIDDPTYETDKPALIGKLAKGLEINTINGMIYFRISDENFESLFSSLTYDLDSDILKSINKEEKGYTLEKIDGKMFLHGVRPTTLLGNVYYIEVLRDVEHIFESQQLQYKILTRIIVLMFIVGGVVTAVISKILMKPIEELSKATTEISKGDFSKRIEIKGDDEFSILSSHFNSMTNDLEQKIRQLEEEADKKELFVGAFSHELKTPLTSIIGYSDMLRSRKMSEESISLCANYIYTEGKRLESLSMRMLELIVIKNQAVKLRKVNVEEFFNGIEAVMNPILSEHNILLFTRIQPAKINIEPDLMKTVFINLIDNGRKAIRENGKIQIKGELVKDKYIISIIDNGKGMEANELDKITKAYYRIDKSRAREDGGAGLGLAICDEILKVHNSNISFESEVNIGTKVTVVVEGEESYEDF